MTRSDIAADMPNGTRSGRKQNRVAMLSHLHELGFVGVDVTMDARDYALIDIADIPEARKKVAEAYFKSADNYHREPGIDCYQWGCEI